MREKHVNEKYTETLPYEIWIQIVAFLHLKDIVSFAFTSKEGQSIARDREIWTLKAWQHYLIKQSEKIEYPGFIKLYQQKYSKIKNIENRKIFSMIIDNDSERLEKMNLSMDRFHQNKFGGYSLYYWASKKSVAIHKSIFDKVWKYYYDTALNKIDINKVDTNGYSILHWAAATQSVALICDLISAGAEVNKSSLTGTTPLYIAAEYGHLEAIKVLLDADADVTACANEGDSSLYIAAKNGHLNIVNALLDAHADVNARLDGGCTSLYSAAENGHLDVVKALIDAHADINVQLANATTPLYIAAQNGHLEIVKTLLDAHADINARTHYGSTSLYIAAQNGHLDVVKVLIDAHADVNVSCTDGSTPLHSAALHGHLDVVMLLLDSHANVNSARVDGVTPLFVAAKNGHLDVVDVLLAAKADIDTIYLSSKKTIFEMATEKKDTNLLILLAKHKLTAFLNETSKPTVYPQKTMFSRITLFSDFLSKEEKTAAQNHQAALALAEVVFNGASIDSLKPHLKKLKKAELGKIFNILMPSIEKNQQIKEGKEHALTELKIFQNSL